MTRAEHLQWCKDRAAEYLKRGDWLEAWTSFGSDMNQREDTRNNPALTIGTQLLMMGSINNVPDMSRFIDGFN